MVQPTQRELFALLKQIRRDYSHIAQLRLGDIATNETLDILARERPHNLEALKVITTQLTTRERNKILKHWEIFIDRLKYLHIKEEENFWQEPIAVEQKNMFQKILNYF